MVRAGRRRLAGVAAALALLPVLTGCEVSADIVIHTDETADVNAMLWSSATDILDYPDGQDGFDQACPQQFERLGLTGVVVAGSPGPRARGCRAQGRVAVQKLVDLGLITHADGRYFVNLSDVMTGEFRGDEFGLALTFPGPVVETDPAALVTGTRVTWPPEGPSRAGARIVAFDQPAAVAWAREAAMPLTAGGVGIGAGAVLARLVWWRRRGRR